MLGQVDNPNAIQMSCLPVYVDTGILGQIETRKNKILYYVVGHAVPIPTTLVLAVARLLCFIGIVVACVAVRYKGQGFLANADILFGLVGAWLKVDDYLAKKRERLRVAIVRLEHIALKLKRDSTRSISDIANMPEGPSKQKALLRKIGDFTELIAQVDEYIEGEIVRWQQETLIPGFCRMDNDQSSNSMLVRPDQVSSFRCHFSVAAAPYIYIYIYAGASPH
jgi:hypothetical protein